MSASAPTPTPTHNGSLRDDSAITKSWDRVVSDYKAFHDVRAHGGTVGDLPVFPDACTNGHDITRDAKPETISNIAVQDGLAAVGGPDDLDSGSKDGSVDVSTPNPGPITAQAQAQAQAPSTTVPVPASDTSIPSGPSLLPPQAVLGGADDTMKKLLMSWYYAGYYTGLYEGEQKALQRQTQQPDETLEKQDAKDSVQTDDTAAQQ